MTEGRFLGRRFFARSAPEVAVDLLGATLHSADGVVVRITETEAYTESDPASHSFRGPTPRTRSMFGPPGHLYVYFTYGMHWCANVVTAPEGIGEAVLLRAAKVVRGRELVASRRQRAPERAWTDGPAKLCQALAIDGGVDGFDLCRPGAFRLREGSVTAFRVTPRIGISKGVETPWRFVADDIEADDIVPKTR